MCSHIWVAIMSVFSSKLVCDATTGIKWDGCIYALVLSCIWECMCSQIWDITGCKRRMVSIFNAKLGLKSYVLSS